MSVIKFILAVSAITTSVHAQPSQTCLSDAEATNLFIVMAPSAIEAMRQTCSGILPADAVLLQPSNPLNRDLQAASAEAWPKAMPAIAKLAQDDGIAISAVDGGISKAMFHAVLGGMLKDMIKQKDCVPANRLITLLQPLPVQNVAGVFLELARFGLRNNKDDEPSSFNLCDR